MSALDGIRAWQAAIQVAVRTRALLTHLPPRGYAELRDQMIRSSESIATNIAEGRGSGFPGEYIRYLDTAARSAHELSSQLRTVMEYGVAPKRESFNLNGTVICTRRMIESLREAVRADAARDTRKRAKPRTRKKRQRRRRKP
jgi:four helix bundle protein